MTSVVPGDERSALNAISYRFTKDISKNIEIPIYINSKKLRAMLDSGADETFISLDCAQSLQLPIDTTEVRSVFAFDNSQHRSIGTTKQVVELKSDSEIQKITLNMVVLMKLPCDVILGRAFLCECAVINYRDCHVELNAPTKLENQSSNAINKMACLSVMTTNNLTNNSINVAAAEEKKVVNSGISDYIEGVELRDAEVDGEKSVLNDQIDEVSMEKLNVEAEELLGEFAEIFDETDQQKTMPNKQLVIETGKVKPIKEKTRRLNEDEIETIKEETDRLLNKGVIRRSNSSWSFPTVLVAKKDGRKRLCIDYRNLNAITKADCYPLPRISEILALHVNHRIFSSIDLKDGFFHLKIKPEDQCKTAFSTPFGLFEYNVAPFGLKNTPSAFQRAMCEVLAPVSSKCTPFIDDIIVSSLNFEQHLEDLKQVFMCLRDANLTLNKLKCKLFKNEVTVLGHRISKEGIQASEANLRNIENFPVPSRKKEVQAFLGLINYVAKFIPHLSKDLLPLRKLIRKSSRFEWTADHSTCFEEIKRKFAKPTVLAFPDNQLDKIIAIESDRETISAMLMQKMGNEIRLVECRCRTLSDTETRYNVYEKEALALQLGFTSFRHYLGQSKIQVVSILPEFKNCISRKVLPTRLSRILLEANEFEFEVKLSKSAKRVNTEDICRENNEFEHAGENVKTVYVDGASVGNGTPSCRASFGVWWGHDDPLNSAGEIDQPASNQRAELTAALVALQQAVSKGLSEVRIISDSQYLVSSQKEWIIDWEKNGKLTTKGKPVANCDLHFAIRDLTKRCKVYWQHVPGHSGIPGNVEADRLATEALQLKRATLSIISIEDSFFREQRSDRVYSTIVQQIENGDRVPAYSLSKNLLYKETTNGLRLVVPISLRKTILYLFHDNPAMGGHHGVFKTFEDISSTYWWPYLRKTISEYVRSCHQCQIHKPSAMKPYGYLHPIVSSQVMEKVGIDFIGPLIRTTRGNAYIVVCIDYFSRYVITKPLKEISAKTTAIFLLENVVCQHGAPRCMISDRGAQFTSAIIAELMSLLKIEQALTTPYHPQSNGMCENANRNIIRSLKKYVDLNSGDWDLYLPIVTLSYNISTNKSSGFTPFEIRTGRKYQWSGTSSQEPTNDYLRKVKERLNEVEEKVKCNDLFAKSTQKQAFDKSHRPVDFKAGELVLVKNNAGLPGVARKFQPLFVGPYEVQSISRDGLVAEIDYKGTSKRVSTKNVKVFYQREPSNERVQIPIQPCVQTDDDYRKYMDLATFALELESCSVATPTTQIEVIRDDNDDAYSDSTVVYDAEEPVERVNDHEFDPIETNAYECNACGRSLSSNQSLQRHLLSHSGERPYSCTICGRGFTTNQNRRRHQQLPHPLRFVCEVCGQNFAQRAELRTHSTTHGASEVLPP